MQHLESDSLIEGRRKRILARDLNPDHQSAYGVGYIDGRALGRIEGKNKGFYDGFALSLGIGAVCLLVGYLANDYLKNNSQASQTSISNSEDRARSPNIEFILTK